MLLTKSTTFVFRLKIDFVVVVTTIADIVVAITIVDIIVNKFDFVMTNMYFIFVAINTRCTTSKFEKTLKIMNIRSVESLNENYIHQKLDSYEIIKNWNSLFFNRDRATFRNAYIDFDKKNIYYFFLVFVRNLFSLRQIFSFCRSCVYDF